MHGGSRGKELNSPLMTEKLLNISDAVGKRRKATMISVTLFGGWS
jgi:hypothetical protein